MFGSTPRRELLEPNLGDAHAEIAIVGGKHVNVHSGEILKEDVAIVGDRIAYVGDVDHTIGPSTRVIDAEGQYVTPGLIDGHHHSYHSYINGTEFAKAMLVHGTTAYADGFYAQAIVGGMDALEFRKETMQRTPLSLIFLAPCVAVLQCSVMGLPRTSEKGIVVEDLHEMLEWDDCYGLEEPTPEPVLERDEVYLDLLDKTIELGKVVSGHAAGVDERTINAFLAMGLRADHEMATTDEAVEWLRRGVHLLGRYGSGAPDVPEIVKALTEEGLDGRNFGFSCDVLEARDLVRRGAIDQNVRAAIANGLDPITAVQAGTITTAEALRVDHELGSIAPGKVADVLLVDDLTSFSIDTVVANGEVVAEGGEFVGELTQPEYPAELMNTINLPRKAVPEDFAVSAGVESGEVSVRTIVIEDGSYVTEEGRATLPVEGGDVQVDTDAGVVKGAMLDRHQASGRMGLAFVEGFDLERGAFGTSANGVRENVLLVGTNDEDMATVVNRIHELQGGIVAVGDGEILGEVSLKLSGLQSIQPLEDAIEDFERLSDAIDRLGCDLTSPLATLEFIGSMPGIPLIRLSEHGLLNAMEAERLDIVVEE